jgi:hypothetical protein
MKMPNVSEWLKWYSAADSGDAGAEIENIHIKYKANKYLHG